MEQRSNAFIELASQAIAEPGKAVYRSVLGEAMPRLRDSAVQQFGGDEAFDALRHNVRDRRRHSSAHLAYYLEQFVARARENGNTVHFARDSEELNDRVLAICQAAQVQRVIKGKSMVTEETGLNKALQDAGLDVRETDLGEYIIQEAGETPSHIVGPALHKTPTRSVNFSWTATTWETGTSRPLKRWSRRPGRCCVRNFLPRMRASLAATPWSPSPATACWSPTKAMATSAPTCPGS